MSIQRGDVVIIDWPFAGGVGGKARPALVIQNDRDNVRLLATVVAMITSRTHRSKEPTQVLVDVRTSDGQQSGLHHTSVVNCVNLFTVEQGKILHTIGKLPVALMQQVNAALKAALDLP